MTEQPPSATMWTSSPRRPPAWACKRAIILAVLVLAVFVLAVLKPTEEAMKGRCSETMQALIAEDENSTRKHVTVTYNSLIVINYCSFSSSGAKAETERFVGFAGQVYPADAGATKVAGLTYGQTMVKVIIPQSVRRMIPPVCNEFIMILKDASLVFAISLMDITTISKNIMTSEGSCLVCIPALVIYLVITAIFSFVFDKIEARFSIYE